MNCKPGDLAVVIGADNVPANIGRWVLVVRFAIDGERIGCGVIDRKGDTRPGWVIRCAAGRTITAWSTAGFPMEKEEAVCRDANLRPIRDPGDDAQDETLQWLPVPSQHKEVA